MEKAAGVLFIVSGLGYIIFPPFYEEGIGKTLVPVLGCIHLLLAYDLLRGQKKYRKYFLAIAIGSLAIAVPFWGKSAEFYGSLTIPMVAVESVFVLAATLLLLTQSRKNMRNAIVRVNDRHHGEN